MSFRMKALCKKCGRRLKKLKIVVTECVRDVELILNRKDSMKKILKKIKDFDESSRMVDG